MRYQIYEAKSVKYDAQQRVGIKVSNLKAMQHMHSLFSAEKFMLNMPKYLLQFFKLFVIMLSYGRNL